MPIFDPEPRVIEVRSDEIMDSKEGNKLLFKFYPSEMEIEIKERGYLYTIKLDDLQEFAKNSQQDVFHVKLVSENKDDG
jgi:hypothetical protein